MTFLDRIRSKNIMWGATRDYLSFSDWETYRCLWNVRWGKSEFQHVIRTGFNRVVGGMP